MDIRSHADPKSWKIAGGHFIAAFYYGILLRQLNRLVIHVILPISPWE